MTRPRLRMAMVWTVAAIAGLYACFAAAIFVVMHQSNTVAGKGLSLLPGPALALVRLAPAPTPST